MTVVQFIISPSGDELAVIPRSDYDRMTALANEATEDAADASAYVEAKAEWEANGRPTFPPELSALLVKSKSRLAAIRNWRELSQEALAVKAEVQQGYLSDIEMGKRSAAQATVDRLAKALDVPADWLT